MPMGRVPQSQILKSTYIAYVRYVLIPHSIGHLEVSQISPIFIPGSGTRLCSRDCRGARAAQRSQELWSTIPPCPHELPTIFCRIFRFWASLTILTKLGSFLFTVSFTIQLSREQELQHVSLRSQHCATRLAVSVAWICGLDHTLRGKRRA